MKILILFLSSVITLASCRQSHFQKVTTKTNKTSIMNNKNVYDFSVKDINGNNYNLSQLKGKKVMIVNTASECGLTPQFRDLEALYEKYKDKNFSIIGFPTNDFGAQDPGTNEQIAAFCTKNYGVTFPMMSKIVVVGDNKHELYKFLTEKSLNGLEDNEVKRIFSACHTPNNITRRR